MSSDNKAKNDSKLKMAKSSVEDANRSHGAGTKSLKKKKKKGSKMNDSKTNLSNMALKGTPEAENNLCAKTEDHANFEEKQSCSETVKQAPSGDTGQYEPLADTSNILAVSGDQASSSSQKTNTNVQPREVINAQNCTILEDLSSNQGGLHLVEQHLVAKGEIIKNNETELSQMQHHIQEGGYTTEAYNMEGHNVGNTCSTGQGGLDNKGEKNKDGKKAGDTDIETTYLSVLVSPSNLGYTPATQLDNLIKESAQSLDVVSKTHTAEVESALTQPIPEPCLHFTELEASSESLDHLAHTEEKPDQPQVEIIETVLDQEKNSVGGTEICVKDSDSNTGLLQSYILSDVGSLNLKPDGAMGESSNGQFIQNSLSTTSIDFKPHKEENLGSKTRKDKEESLSQQEKESIEGTPCVTTNKLLGEEKDNTSNLQSNSIVCMSDSQLVAKEMDACVPKTCIEPGYHGLPMKAEIDEDVLELPALQKETISSESDVNSTPPDQNQLLEKRKEDKSIEIHKPSQEGNVDDVSTLGICDYLQQGVISLSSTTEVSIEKCVIDAQHSGEMQVGNMSELQTGHLFLGGHCENEDTSPSSGVEKKNLTAISSNESSLSPSSFSAVSETEMPNLMSNDNEHKTTISQVKKKMDTYIFMTKEELQSEEASSVEDIFTNLPGKADRDQLGLTATDTIFPNTTTNAIKDNTPAQTPSTMGLQSCADESNTESINHGDLPQDTVHDGKVSESHCKNKHTEKVKPQELSEECSVKIGEESSDHDTVSITPASEQTQVIEAMSDAQTMIKESIAENQVENVEMSDGALEKTILKEPSQEDETNTQTPSKLSISEPVKSTTDQLVDTASDISDKSKNVTENVLNIHLEDTAAIVSLSDDERQNFSTVPADQFNIIQHELSELTCNVISEKSEETLDIQQHQVNQEIHPQEKHPEMVCDKILNISSDKTEVTGWNSEEPTTPQHDKVGIPEQEDVLVGSSKITGSLSMPESDSITQLISDESNKMTEIQGLEASVQQDSPPEKHELSSKIHGHFVAEDLGSTYVEVVNPPQEIDTTLGSEATVVASTKLSSAENLNQSPKGGQHLEIVSLTPQPTDGETSAAKIDFVSNDTEIKKENITSKELGLAVKEIEETSTFSDIIDDETTMMSDEMCPTETDILFDIPCLGGTETYMHQDIPHHTPTETDILSDISCRSPTETDLLSDDLCFTPHETDILSEGTSPVPTELLSKEKTLPESNVIAEEVVFVPKDIETLHEISGPNLLEIIKTQKDKEINSEEVSTNLNKSKTSSEEQRSTVKNLETGSEAKEPTSTALGTVLDKQASEEDKPELGSEPASQSPVARSPTFPASDSYSFTQKLRSVLHSDRTFPKKTLSPMSPEPLVLPSSARLFGEGAVPERSSDSEEAFETPESTTPVKSAPPVPIPSVPDISEGQEQPLQEEPQHQEEEISIPQALLLTDDTVVFDEDKPIASSGTYNLDFASVEQVDTASCTSEAPAKARRKSTDSVPVSRNTLSRSLSLQAADFQLEDGLITHGGSDSACSTLRRPKKPRPASLKKKPSAKKQTETAGTTDTQQAPTVESQQADVDKNVQDPPVDSEALSQIDTELPAVEGQQISNISPTEILSVTPQEISVHPSDTSVLCPSEDAEKVSPLSVGQQEPEVTPSDTGGPETTAVVGQSVRLEFDYSEEAREGQPPTRKGKKPSGKMPLRKPKAKKPVEKPEPPPRSPSPIPIDSSDIPIGKGTYTYNMDKWDDPNFNPFSSSGKMLDSPLTAQEAPEPFKPAAHRAESPARTPASFEIPASNTEQSGGEGNKPAMKKKKTPLKTDTFRVKKSPKRSPVSENGSEELTLLPTSDAPPVINSEDHATDEEKLASSVSSQKWTCMAVDLEPEKQDYPQPSDLTNFVNETQYHTSSEEVEYSNSYNIEYMEKTGTCSPLRDLPQTQSLYLMFETSQDSTGIPPAKFSESSSPGTGSGFDGMEPALCSGQHSLPRSPPILKDTMHQPLERPRQRDEESGLGSGKMELGTPEDVYVAAETLLSRISQQAALCDQLSYLEPDLAEKNPQAFAQKLQCDGLETSDVDLSHSSLYSRAVAMETSSSGLLLPYQHSDIDAALQLAREEIASKEQEVTEWKKKYEESRCEVVEMRKIVAEYEKTIAQMIEDEQREKSMSHHTVQQLILEKEQALSDLNSVEKSLAELFRRYEKMKEVLEGFRKNEEVLKKCAQEYLARVKKEEQRYHALKIHAEEKLDRANSEIAQVRGKSQQEQVAYQASLRKEQLRVDALERALEQKNKEVEELTKICDELIAKMGKS
ncbi:transforming acidic coiled-coil-containing protein 2 isoform 2-T2 [Discoglossus pictus]